MGFSLIALIILSMTIESHGNVKINVVHKWIYPDFVWDGQKENVENSGSYNPYKCFLHDGTKAENGIIFVTMPHKNHCSPPATLMTVTNETGPGGSLLYPYPNWSWYNNNCTCNGIVNAQRIHVRCNHIVVLDNGRIGTKQICQPKILIFDLKDNMLIKTISIPLDIATNQKGSGLLVALFVYIPNGNCSRFPNEIIIFIVVKGNGLVVYDSSTKRMCRVESKYMEPTGSDLISTNNCNCMYSDGISTVTVLGDELYFAVSRKAIYKIKIKTLLECPNKKKANKNTELVITLSSQTGQITSAGKSVFYSDSRVNQTSIFGTYVFEKHGVLLAQYKTQAMVSSLKVSSYWKVLIAISNRLSDKHYFVFNKANLNKINSIYFEMDMKEVQRKMNMNLKKTNLTNESEKVF